MSWLLEQVAVGVAQVNKLGQCSKMCCSISAVSNFAACGSNQYVVRLGAQSPGTAFSILCKQSSSISHSKGL